MIINFITDNDLYKFTMQHAVINLFPLDKVRYQFISRDHREFPKGFDLLLRAEVDAMANLKLTKQEKDFLRKRCYYLPETYLDFLEGYRFDPSEVKIKQEGSELKVSIEGFWYRTILWEVPLMAIISELYFRATNATPYNNGKCAEILQNKIDAYDNLDIKVADFGTRRRYSFDNHDKVLYQLKNSSKSCFVGTSNVYLAMKYDTTPIGTHAHEWFMYHAAMFGYKLANKLALENWVNIYRGDLGIALSDTFTTDVFFRSFDTMYAKLFDGVRHDSGDPVEFANKTIEHYKKLRIDPTTKTIVFSDALNPEAVESIVKNCSGKIRMSFGIGTNFTNDVGVKPMNMVIKLSEVYNPNCSEWVSTVKLSDNPGKHTGNPEEIELAKRILMIK